MEHSASNSDFLPPRENPSQYSPLFFTRGGGVTVSPSTKRVKNMPDSTEEKSDKDPIKPWLENLSP